MKQESNIYRDRLDRLSSTMHTMELDGIALNPGPDLFYYTGLHFHLSERPVVLIYVPGRKPAIILPQLELLKLDSCPFEVSVYAYSEDPGQRPYAFRDAIDAIGVDRKRLGIAPRSMRVLEHTLLTRAAASTLFLDAGELLSGVRMVKSPEEIEMIASAIRIAESALLSLLPLIKEGMSERELAGELHFQLIQKGSDPNLPFMPIVASGPNSANPHAAPGSRTLKPGDALLIDWGAAYRGYGSDLTRTFVVKEPDSKLKEVHEVVRMANYAARKSGGLDSTCNQVDRAAREVIEQAGLGHLFTHRTGHGIGLESHEAPYIRESNNQRLKNGMTYTVEPGIYLPDFFGVRIEDDMVIDGDHAVSLSTLDRSLVVVG